MNMSKTKAAKNQLNGNERAMRELANMKHRELQRACIVRGMNSQVMVDSDHHKLVSFFLDNYDNSQDEGLLLIHDIWVEGELQKKGYKKGEALLSPALRFSYNGNIEQMEKPITIKPKEIPQQAKKPKSTMDETTGVRSGTKKALTYSLTLEGLEIDEILKQVKTQFPDAQDKSVSIWHKKALKINK